MWRFIVVCEKSFPGELFICTWRFRGSFSRTDAKMLVKCEIVLMLKAIYDPFYGNYISKTFHTLYTCFNVILYEICAVAEIFKWNAIAATFFFLKHNLLFFLIYHWKKYIVLYVEILKRVFDSFWIFLNSVYSTSK